MEQYIYYSLSIKIGWLSKEVDETSLTCVILAWHLHWKFFWTVTSSSGAEKINYLSLLLYNCLYIYQTWRWSPLKTCSIHESSLPEVSPHILYLAPEQRTHNCQPDILIKTMLTLCFLCLPGGGCLVVLLWEAASVPHLPDLDTSLT